MRKSVFVKALIILLPIFLLNACSEGGVRIASAAPDLSLRDTNGNIVQLSAFKGKVIILDFFSTSCPPCRQEIPDFIALQKQYGDQGFVMIGVSLSGLGDVKPFAERFGMNYTILVANSRAVEAYGPIRAIPLTFVIDKEFKVAKKYIGYRPKEVFEGDIKELLSK